MIRKNINQKGLINKNDSSEGETIEIKIERITTTKEPITDGAPLIYTDRRRRRRIELNEQRRGNIMTTQQRRTHLKAARSIARTLGIRRAAGFLRNMGWSIEGAVAALCCAH